MLTNILICSALVLLGGLFIELIFIKRFCRLMEKANRFKIRVSYSFYDSVFALFGKSLKLTKEREKKWERIGMTSWKTAFASIGISLIIAGILLLIYCLRYSINLVY